jgi:hypothetical protein
VLFYTAIIYYTVISFGYMVLMHNPLLATIVYKDFYDENDTFNLKEMKT